MFVKVGFVLLFLSTVECLGFGPGPDNVAYVEAPLAKQLPGKELWLQFLRYVRSSDLTDPMLAYTRSHSDNLEQDMLPWRQRAPIRSVEVLNTFKNYTSWYIGPATLQLVLVYNNSLFWLDRPDPNGPEPNITWASQYIIKFHRRMTAALQSGRVTLPNLLFIHVADDNIGRFGDPRRGITAPPLSLMKSRGQEGGDDLDILVPQMRDVSDSLHIVPWHLKNDIAFFRGICTCTGKWNERYGYPDVCARASLAYYSERDKRAGNATVLDVAITEPYPYRSRLNSSIGFDLPVAPAVPIPGLSVYKYLLNLEGMVAAYRLSQLMTVNSLVLFQRTVYIEFFYRSLQPWQHYVPFWNATAPDGTPLGMDDVYSVMKAVRRMDREDPAAVQKIIGNSQNFAAQLLTNHMRIAYYKAALEAYKSLFPDMDSFIEEYLPVLREKGWKVP